MENKAQESETDLNKLKALLSEFGVGFDVTERDDGVTVECETGAEKVVGYFGFATLFVFSKEGRFIEMGAYQ